MPLSMMVFLPREKCCPLNSIILQALCETYIHRRLVVPSSGLTFTA